MSTWRPWWPHLRARQIERSPDDMLTSLRNKSLPELEALLDRTLPDDPPPSFAWLCRMIVPLLVDNASASELLTRACAASAVNGRQFARALGHLLPEEAQSALLAVCPCPTGGEGWLREAATSLAKLAIDVPSMAVAVHADRAAWEQFSIDSAQRREAAMLREGLVALEPFASDDTWRHLSERTTAADAPLGAVRNLSVYGGAERSLELLAEAVEATARPAETVEEQDRAQRGGTVSLRSPRESSAFRGSLRPERTGFRVRGQAVVVRSRLAGRAAASCH